PRIVLPVPVVIPQTDSPALSVLIVVYGGGELAIDAVAALIEHTEQPFEVILVDNASKDDSLVALRDGIVGLTLIAEDHNLGFGGGNNRAAREARAPVICMLNPDARVTAEWLNPLLAVLHDPSVGAVAPALIGADGTLQEVGAMVDHWGYTGPAGTRGFGEPVPAPAGRLAVDYASAACLLMRTDVFRSMEGFDPTYRLAYYEDVDLCMRLWQRGLKVIGEPASRVIHLGGGTVTPVVSQALWHHNRSVFLHRWRDELATRPSYAAGTDDDMARLWAWRTKAE
ncbi:MAG TPA: glycosyltransferase family 2 protein, partial [Ilumatobacteraceae bacterium]|nr:glycosyltransferase family 2 protein [Ilumatobacteraceae bacterium]